MDLVSPILDIFTRLWDCTSQGRVYICCFEQKLLNLRAEMGTLHIVEEDIRRRVQKEERQDYLSGCTDRVECWLRGVNTITYQVEELRRRGETEIQNKCLGNCCPRNCRSRYKLGKEMSIKTTEVQTLMRKGCCFQFVTERVPRPPVDEIPMEQTLGLDSMFTHLLSCFQYQAREDRSTQVIVGKTTLLKKLNNAFGMGGAEAVDYDVVIWIVLSKDVNLWKIQEVIREKLEIPDGMWKDKVTEPGRAVEILTTLKRKRFLLLLDDVWDPIDLAAVGVPLDNTKGSRIVLTTRKEQVCGLMNAHKRFRVECLSTEAAMDLFRLKVGEDVLKSHPEIPKLAEIVVQECKGLPLALVTVGGAMANWRTPDDWKREIKVLQSYPFEIDGMDELVFHRLRYSYDSLSDETLKNWVLCCSLFPEDHNIMKDELIELWIREGFLDKFDDIYDARNHGESIIGRLKLLSLLETGEYKSIVKMHDVIRDMALKLAPENENKILVQQRHGLIKPLGFSRIWKDVKRVSLWGPNIEFFGETPSCSDLISFLIRNTKLKKFLNTCFESMKALKVLDLSYNKALA